MIEFKHKTAPGNTFRPTPEVIFEPNDNLLIVVTPWGARERAKLAANEVKEYILSARTDMESTSPFERLAHLSPAANNVRTAALLANRALFEEVNSEEYSLGIELFVAYLSQRELVCFQVGQPHLLFSQPQTKVMPVSLSFDHSMNLDPGSTRPPLPQNILGLDMSIPYTINSLRPEEGAHLVLISSSVVPSEIFELDNSEMNLEKLEDIIVSNGPNHPYWIGDLQI